MDYKGKQMFGKYNFVKKDCNFKLQEIQLHNHTIYKQKNGDDFT